MNCPSCKLYLSHPVVLSIQLVKYFTNCPSCTSNFGLSDKVVGTSVEDISVPWMKLKNIRLLDIASKKLSFDDVS